MLTLMVSCLLSLSGCSSKAVTPPTYIYVKESIPKDLLEVECGEVGFGDSVRTLAYGYVMNRGCLRAHIELVEGLKRNYTKEGSNNDTSNSSGK